VTSGALLCSRLHLSNIRNIYISLICSARRFEIIYATFKFRYFARKSSHNLYGWLRSAIENARFPISRFHPPTGYDYNSDGAPTNEPDPDSSGMEKKLTQQMLAAAAGAEPIQPTRKLPIQNSHLSTIIIIILI
jgi:hypothetical protein